MSTNPFCGIGVIICGTGHSLNPMVVSLAAEKQTSDMHSFLSQICRVYKQPSPALQCLLHVLSAIPCCMADLLPQEVLPS